MRALVPSNTNSIVGTDPMDIYLHILFRLWGKWKNNLLKISGNGMPGHEYSADLF
jgi:hypothetical protein